MADKEFRLAYFCAIDHNGNRINAEQYDGENLRLVYGCRYKMTLYLTNTLENNSEYLFNYMLFAPQGYIPQLNNFAGFRIIVDVDNAQVTVAMQGNVMQSANHIVECRYNTPYSQEIDFIFYAWHDFPYFLDGINNVSNEYALQSTKPYTGTLYDNTFDSIWNNQHRNILVTMYDLSSHQFLLNTDRNSLYGSYPCVGRFLCSNDNATNIWVNSNTFNCNALVVVQNLVFSNSNSYYRVRSIRKDYDYYSKIYDNNFSYALGATTSIIDATKENQFKVDIKCNGFNPIAIQARIIKVEPSAFLNQYNFVKEYELSEVTLPDDDITSYPNPIEGNDIFSTPSTWQFNPSSNMVGMVFSINGNYLTENERYRIFFSLHDIHGLEHSSHITPIMTVLNMDSPTFDANVIFQTYNESVVNKSPITLSIFDRYKTTLQIDADTYSRGLAQLENELVGVQISRRSTSGSPQTIETAYYDYQLQQSTGNYPIVFNQAGNNKLFSCEFEPIRVINNYLINYDLFFKIPRGNNTFRDLNVYLPSQTVNGIVDYNYYSEFEFLDYNTNLPIDIHCIDKSPYVKLKVKQIVAEAANVIANIYFATSNTNGSSIYIKEEEAYNSPYLPLRNTQHIVQVPTTFDANGEAIIVLDTSLIPSNILTAQVYVTAVKPLI